MKDFITNTSEDRRIKSATSRTQAHQRLKGYPSSSQKAQILFSTEELQLAKVWEYQKVQEASLVNSPPGRHQWGHSRPGWPSKCLWQAKGKAYGRQELREELQPPVTAQLGHKACHSTSVGHSSVPFIHRSIQKFGVPSKQGMPPDSGSEGKAHSGLKVTPQPLLNSTLHSLHGRPFTAVPPHYQSVDKHHWLHSSSVYQPHLGSLTHYQSRAAQPHVLLGSDHLDKDHVPPQPFFQRLRDRLTWWVKAGATKEVLSILSEGVKWNFPIQENLSLQTCKRSQEETSLALDTVKEYLEVGALKEIAKEEAKHLIPWFVIKKGEKLRLITDCRELNKFFTPQPFKLEGWQEIFPVLRKGMWAAKIDLKHAYFHMGINPNLQPFTCIEVENKVYQFQAACFGMSPLPQIWQSIMKTFLKRWRSKGYLTWIYLDDILVLGSTPKMLENNLKQILADLEASGLVINHKKSQLTPTQTVDHLGFTINFHHGTLQVPTEKLKSIRKELGKLITNKVMTCRRMAAILGSVRAFLTAMPFLRAFTDQMVQFVKNQEYLGWDKKVLIPQTLQNQVKELGILMEQWKGRTFQGKAPVRILHSDSSQEAWAGVDVNNHQVVQEFWREKRTLHINVKELEAAINTVKSFARPKEKVSLSVDNSVTYHYLRKGGGKIPSLNSQIRPFLRWCMDNQISLEVNLVKSAECLADGPSRWKKDKGDYTLDRKLFQTILHHFQDYINPKVDMFASPGNNQLPKFVSRYPHWQAMEVNSLKCPLNQISDCYANPPWKVIGPWLHRLRENKNVRCLMITPFWVSSSWWPLLLKLRVKDCPIMLIPPFQGMFRNCWGELMPPPHWHLACTVLSGKAWKANKSRVTWWTLT